LVEISHRERLVRAKIIYYGPAAGGKTTNLLVLHRRADPKRRGEMVSVNSTQDRTILMDLLPVKTPAFRSYELRFQVIAVPGQRLYSASRRLLLNGADSVVFVGNSAADRWEETLESFREMNQNLISHGLDPATIPVVFQYNKRDLPELTPLEAMDRTLNVRRVQSFPAVAIREEGVLETFSAALGRTMSDLTTRYKLGEGLRPGRSIKEWTAETMRLVFSWKPQEPELEAPERIAVRVPVVESSGPRTAAAPGSDPQAAEALVESYAEAASRLTIALEDHRDENDRLRKRLEELSAPVDAARELLAGAPAPLVLEKVLERVSSALGSEKGSLSLVRPDGELEPVLLRGLEIEPLFDVKDGEGRPLASSTVKSGIPLVYIAGEPGRLAEVLDRLGADVGSLVAIPVATPVRHLGLLAFYLPSESPAPNVESMAHLARIGQGLALALEVASGAIASERLERMQRTALVGQIAERAMLEIGHPIERLFAAVGRIRSRRDGPPWLLEELLGLGSDLSRTRELRASVLGFMADTTPSGITDVEELLQQVKTEFEAPLRESGVSLHLEQRPDALTIQADPFLLRCALMVLVNHFRHSLTGLAGAAVSIRAERTGESVSISVSDNVPALPGDDRATQVPDYLAWSLDRKVSAFGLTLVKALVEHLTGQWRLESLEESGSRITLILPAG